MTYRDSNVSKAIYHVSDIASSTPVQYAESQKALMAANRDIQVSQREHEDYKQRAAAILQVTGLLVYNRKVLRDTICEIFPLIFMLIFVNST